MRYMYNCRWLGASWAAITLAEWICVREAALPEHLMRHEEVHVRQWRWCGYVLFPVVYGIGWLIGLARVPFAVVEWADGVSVWRKAYWLSPLEVAARRAEVP